MKTLGRQYHHTLMDRSLPPAARVAPGEDLVIETLDACYGRVRSIADFLRFRDGPDYRPDPLTGPVYIEGARPGGGLVVDIRSVELDDTGFQLIGPHRAIIRDEVVDWDCYSVQIREGKVCLSRGLELPIDPVIGTLGNAPAETPTNHPNRLGGNLDCPQIRIGARVYLPVEVEGAMFFLGDVHARQGDGEIVGAPEIGARVTVCFELLDQAVAAWPMVEDAESWHVVTAAATEGEALRLGVFEMARFVERRYRVSFNDAMVLLTMCVSLRCSRTGGWGDLERVVCTGFPKRLMEQATAGSGESLKQDMRRPRP
ncbi:MAG: acetamidase/formamidase family protein [Planctomycetia bacterium]|nr:acetamidase/formamidase family protein [Planctomycetia bacterium]